VRKAIGGVEVVTFNVGINDLGQAGRSYKNGTCCGTENEGGLRAAVEPVEENWDTIAEEISKRSWACVPRRRSSSTDDRARGILPRTHLRRGVPGLQDKGSPLGIANHTNLREFLFSDVGE
jgi:hypothetical protein